MKRIFYLFLPVFITTGNIQAQYTLGGYIEAVSLNNGLYYRIDLYLVTDGSRLVGINKGKINFGDGSIPVRVEKPDTVKRLNRYANRYTELFVYHFYHVYPGPGSYLVSYKENNRNGGIINISNSLNTPFYVETFFLIDPYYGNNSSPHILNYFPLTSQTGKGYLFPVSSSEPDEDSITYEAIVPGAGQDEKVDSFKIPSTIKNGIITSQMFTAGYNGDIIWQDPDTSGEYVYAAKINEWKNTPSGAIRKGYMILDFTMILIGSQFPAASLNMSGDTAFVRDRQAEIPFMATGQTGDSLTIQVFSDLPPGVSVSLDRNDSSFYIIPVTGEIIIRNTESVITGKPYKSSWQ